jgi:hypothetical protein
MYYNGIIIGVLSFVIIGLFHPLIIHIEYHFGTKPWPVFLIGGIALCVFSLRIENTIINALLGLVAFCSFWSIKELFQQKKRVERGWFPQKAMKKMTVTSK